MSLTKKTPTFTAMAGEQGAENAGLARKKE